MPFMGRRPLSPYCSRKPVSEDMGSISSESFVLQKLHRMVVNISEFESKIP